MRRKDRQCSTEEALEILDSAVFGVLSMVDDGKPYCVPLNFVRDGNVLIFHCALQGRKIDILRQTPDVVFCTAGQHSLDHSEPLVFSAIYSSVIVFGTAEIIEDKSRKIDDLIKLTAKYFPESSEDAAAAANIRCEKTCVVEIIMGTITGKKGH
ncbi:MFS transporter [Planctomycetales bacterium]|nr:MFS transporter [Planctomycetales bacterium]